MPSLKVKRGSRSQIDAAASSGSLNAGEPYLVTDEGRLAVGLSTTTYETFAKQTETGFSASFPFYKASGVSDTIALVSGTYLPFFNSSGSAKNILLTT